MNTVSRAALSADLTGVTAGTHEMRIREEGIYGIGPFSTPVQYVTGIDVVAPAAVPEPGSIALAVLGILGLAGYGLLCRKKVS